MNWKWFIPAGVAAAAAGVWALLRGRAGVAGAVDAATGAAKGAAEKLAQWAGDVRGMQGKLNGLLKAAGKAGIGVDGKAGTQTCRAAEWAIATGVADDDIKAFAMSKFCGGGAARAPCGITGPLASDAVKQAVLDAAVKKGYPRADVDKAVRRESGWHPSAVACVGSPKHAVAGGLLQFIPIALKSVAFEGSPDQFAALSGEAQLPYLLKFLSKMPPSTLHLPGDFGLALFTPGYVGKPDDFVIYKKGSQGWEQNPGLRLPGNGDITAGSVRATAR